MMETRITKMFGMTTPVLSAGMAFVSRPELAAAVSNAGGMGFLAAEMTPPHEVADLVRATRRLTSRPFGIEFMTPYFTQWHLDACIADPAAVVAFLWGIPDSAWIEALQDAGSQVWVRAASLDEARRAEREGADAVIVEAPEGGPEYVGARLLNLLAGVVDAVEIPVTASASAVDGTGLLAALLLGAAAVRCGTIFLPAEEANAVIEYARSMAGSPIDATLRVNLLTREWPDRPGPMLTRPVVSEWLRGKSQPHGRPAAVGAARSRSMSRNMARRLPASKLFEMLIEPDSRVAQLEPAMAIQPAAEILAGIASEARQIVEKQEGLCAVA
jgi:NAD(P)H-dependent flavin oxidoreductase YrpB (nitropropane dioxygenase family)